MNDHLKWVARDGHIHISIGDLLKFFDKNPEMDIVDIARTLHDFNNSLVDKLCIKHNKKSYTK